MRMLVALVWVAAGFLYSLGVSLEGEEVRLLARLGAWEARQNRKPGRDRVSPQIGAALGYAATEAWLAQYQRDQGPLPPQIAAFL
jgi:hypothetical protein